MIFFAAGTVKVLFRVAVAFVTEDFGVEVRVFCRSTSEKVEDCIGDTDGPGEGEGAERAASARSLTSKA